MRYDYIVHQELCLGLGRVLSIGFFLLLAAPMNQMLLARIVVVVAGAAPLPIWAGFARIPTAASAAARAEKLGLPAPARVTGPAQPWGGPKCGRLPHTPG